jgi:hypothetical protein
MQYNDIRKEFMMLFQQLNGSRMRLQLQLLSPLARAHEIVHSFGGARV